jgi:hypothetical protein
MCIVSDLVGRWIEKKGIVVLLNYVIKHHVMNAYWGSGGIAPPFLTSVLDGREWSDSCPGRFTPDTHWTAD